MKLTNVDKTINVCGNVIEETKSEKLLGLVVNNELSWKQYLHGEKWRPIKEENFEGLLPKLSKRIGLLTRLRNKMFTFKTTALRRYFKKPQKGTDN